MGTVVAASSSVDGVAVGLRFVLVFVFFFAAIPKTVRRAEFESAVAGYALVPARWVGFVAAWLPRLELACALGLLLGAFVVPLGIAAGTLLVTFAGAAGLNLLRGRAIDCGCSGAVAPRQISWGLVIADFAMAGAAFFVATKNPRVLVIATAGSRVAHISNADGLALLALASTVVVGQLLITARQRLTATTRALKRDLSGGVFS